MATALNDPGCVVSRINTGLPSCDFLPGPIAWACLLPKATELSAAEMTSSAAFITKMQALVIGAATVRAYPIGKLDNPEDKSEEPIFEKTKYGSSIFVRNGKYIWRFYLVNTGLRRLANLQAFNQTAAYKIIFADSSNTVFGAASTAVAGGMKGFAIDNIHFFDWKMADGSVVSKGMVEVTLGNRDELNPPTFLKLDYDPDEVIKGLIDVDIVQHTLTPAASIIVQVVERISRVNLYSLYSAALNSLTVWTVTKAGAPVTPASIALSAANEGFLITLTTPAGDHVFSLVSPALLDAASIGGPPDNGYESGTLTATFAQP